MSRFIIIVLCLGMGQYCAAKEKVESLIDKLVEVSQPGYGYAAYFSGSEFLPYPDTGKMVAEVLGGGAPVRSEVLRQIVEQGIDAVPALIKHIGDDRKIKMKPLQGISVTEFIDLYDFNNRTRKDIPKGVNRDFFDDDKNHPNKHSLTVGDLCFVALGQIVNRRYSTATYVPSGILSVSSPSYSKRLREIVIQDWQGLTREQHIQRLVEDFNMPDDEDRLFEAYLRLSYYYPETLGPLVIKHLEKPTYDAEKVSVFVNDRLYKNKDKNQRQKLFDEFIRINGEVYAAGVMNYLYDVLQYLDETGLGPDSKEPEMQAPALLTELFDRPAPVKYSDRPVIPAVSVDERSSFIRSLTYDNSSQVGEALHRVYLSNPKDKQIVPACLSALANRGYADFLIQQLAQFDFTTEDSDDFLLRCLESLSSSREKAVQKKLLDIALETPDDGYFFWALYGVQKPYPLSVFKHANEILDNLPETSEYDWGILEMIGQQFPDRAKAVYQKYLSTGSASRAKMMCKLLRNKSPLAKVILSPLLDDRRELEGFIGTMRVCDFAATVITDQTDKIIFDSDWPLERKDEVIGQIKKYCATPEK